MPKKFHSILFWFDGAFTESVASLALGILRPELTGSEKAAMRQKIQALHQNLAIGKMGANDYCAKAIETCQVTTDAKLLTSKILESASLNRPFFDIYSQIDPVHDPRVIVDIPEVWFAELIRRWQVADAFPTGRLIFTEHFKLERMLPDIAYFIPHTAGRMMEECILVDPLQMRAVALHKLGLVSTAFVYPRRLKIDLALQGIWKTTEDVYHPKAGARTNI